MENNVHFNKIRYIELLKNQTSLNFKEYRELLSYGVILENQIYCNSKDKYFF